MLVQFQISSSGLSHLITRISTCERIVGHDMGTHDLAVKAVLRDGGYTAMCFEESLSYDGPASRGGKHRQVDCRLI